MIVISTCRRPTPRIRSFAKDLTHSLRNCVVVPRGKMSLQDLIDSAVEKEADRLLLVNRWKGEPGEIRLQRLEEGGSRVVYPVIFLRGVKLRREYEVEGRFVAEALTAGRGKIELDVARSLASFLDLPLRSDRGSFCSFHVAENPSRKLTVNLTSPAGTREVGPGFVIRHLAWNDQRSERHEERES